MSVNRVQKLLFSEYCDFEDMVLIESPFAQTTRDGRGIRQVHLGLTPTKLVLATDVLPPVDRACVTYLPGLDPMIETFELIAIYPVECVNLSVFRQKQRQALKAHFCNNKVLFFELGGFEKKSVGEKKWTDRYLYMGKGFEDSCENYKPVTILPAIGDFLKPKPHAKRSKLSVTQSSQQTSSFFKEVSVGDSIQINRFASGISDGCGTGLFLPAGDGQSGSAFMLSQTIEDTRTPSLTSNTVDYCELAENAVRLWEIYKETDPNLYNTRHKRRYGFSPHPLFLHGLGTYNVSKGSRFSIQIKRAVSSVSIRESKDDEFQLPITKRQLITTVSCEALDYNKNKIPSVACSPKKPVILFWTKDYSYKPRSTKESYVDLHTHLKKIREQRERQKEPKGKRTLFRRKYKKEKELICDSESHESDDLKNKTANVAKKRKSSLFNVFGMKTDPVLPEIGSERQLEESSLDYMKRILKMEIVLTAWDFDSTTIAQQLTMIDKDLFLKISGVELSILVWQQSTKSAPNITALVAFSHRISCLVVTEILRNDSEKARARLIARFINIADKCHRMSNFQSCRTILSGLQAPAIFRLKPTWAYVRKKHASKYEVFEHMCRIYRDPRLPVYQRAFFIASQSSPFMPFIGDIIEKLLDRMPEYKMSLFVKSTVSRASTRSSLTTIRSRSEVYPASPPNLVTKLLRNLRLWRTTDDNKTHGRVIKKANKRKRTKTPKSLYEYFKPLSIYEDNRYRCLLETTDFLERCQLSAMTYVFGRNELCKDYLLKSRYREDKENFINSLSVEPPVEYNWHLYNK